MECKIAYIQWSTIKITNANTEQTSKTHELYYEGFESISNAYVDLYPNKCAAHAILI